MKTTTKIDYRALVNARYTMRQLTQATEQAAIELGITPQQHDVLLVLRATPASNPPTIGDLAERLSLRHNSAVGLVDRMVSADLVERWHSADDRRYVFVKLTERGAEILRCLAREHRAELRRIPHTLCAPLISDLDR